MNERTECGCIMLPVARPRVIITSPDANVTVKLIASLNPKRYRLEPIQDLSESLLRAEFVRAHAVLAHIEDFDEPIRKSLTSALDRGVSLVIVANNANTVSEAIQLGALALCFPIKVLDVKRAVLDAVTHAHSQRMEGSDGKTLDAGDASAPSAALPVTIERPEKLHVQRVLLMLGERDAGEIMAATLRSQLGLACVTAFDPADALTQLSRGFDCLVTRPGLLLGSAEGAKLARKLLLRGVSIVPISASDELDVSTAGQIAWALVPQVRRSLKARVRAFHARRLA